MATVIIPNTFVAGTAAVATQVNANFTAITDQLNGNLDADNYANNSVTSAKIRASAAYSVVGRAGATAGAIADIVATVEGTVLVRGVSGLEFGTIGDTGIVAGVNAAKIANGSVSNTEFQYLDGVTSAIQTQLGGKMPLWTSDGDVVDNVPSGSIQGSLLSSSADGDSGRTIGTSTHTTQTVSGGGGTYTIPKGWWVLSGSGDAWIEVRAGSGFWLPLDYRATGNWAVQAYSDGTNLRANNNAVGNMTLYLNRIN